MNNEQRKKRIENFVKLGALAVTGFIVAPFIFIAVKGIIGLALAGAVGLFAVNVGAPWFAMRMANWRIKAINAEAAKNPVESLQNQYMEKEKQAEDFANHIIKFSASVNNFADKLKMFERDYPDEAPKMREQLRKTEQLLANKRAKLVQVNEGLRAFKAEIKKVDAKWKIAQEAIAMNQVANITDATFMEQMIKETAIESVTNSLNIALAEIDAELIEDSRNAQLTNTPQAIMPLIEKEPIGITA